MKTFILILAVAVLVALCEAKKFPKCNKRKGEVYQNCGTACPDNCDNYKEPRACPAVCVEGCFCKKGRVRRNDGFCVKPKKC
uniref:U83-Liphistoxin-Lsp1a_1 n=1 Tax=Liphistius sp. SGP-2016 TaxID=1905180 RepID=A0A4Q8K7X2_9ARAC